ncbi:hypothetical protein QJS66_18280 [Kocuria rhizophila]|nr:hypothetical protein QJS66_18280 [Kocuria rhizophila]
MSSFPRQDPPAGSRYPHDTRPGLVPGRSVEEAAGALPPTTSPSAWPLRWCRRLRGVGGGLPPSP